MFHDYYHFGSYHKSKPSIVGICTFSTLYNKDFIPSGITCRESGRRAIIRSCINASIEHLKAIYKKADQVHLPCFYRWGNRRREKGFVPSQCLRSRTQESWYSFFWSGPNPSPFLMDTQSSIIQSLYLVRAGQVLKYNLNGKCMRKTDQWEVTHRFCNTLVFINKCLYYGSNQKATFVQHAVHSTHESGLVHITGHWAAHRYPYIKLADFS